MNTLKFADNVRNIVQRARRYEVSAQDDATINRLQEEINFLKGILLKTQLGAKPVTLANDHKLSKILDDKKKILARIADNEREKKEILDRSFFCGSSNLDGQHSYPQLSVHMSDTLNLDETEVHMIKSLKRTTPSTDRDMHRYT